MIKTYFKGMKVIVGKKLAAFVRWYK